MTAVDRITAIVAEHEAKGFGCRGCDWLSVFEGAPYMEQFSRHVAERVAAADDLAVIEIEPPDEREDGLAAFSDGSSAGSVVADAGTVYGAGWEWTPEGAVEVGRQWVAAGRWAAAKAAEGVSDRG